MNHTTDTHSQYMQQPNDPGESILAIRSLNKAFGTVQALADLNLDVPRGAVFGLLGPNGAGKTTLLRIINRIMVPDSGTVTIDGRTVDYDTASLIGYMPEERGLYDKMTVRDQILYFGRLRGGDTARMRTVAAEYMDLFRITDYAGRRVEELSKGNQQKVQIIATLVHEPRLLILDEPFSGFDPINGRLLTRLIERLREHGTTVMLSSHNMAAVEEMCDRIALINKGSIILQGRLDDIKEHHRDGSILLTTRTELSTSMLSDSPAVASVETAPVPSHRKGFGYRIHKTPGASNADIAAAAAIQSDIVQFEEALPSLSEIFIRYTSTEQDNSEQ